MTSDQLVGNPFLDWEPAAVPTFDEVSVGRGGGDGGGGGGGAMPGDDGSASSAWADFEAAFMDRPNTPTDGMWTPFVSPDPAVSSGLVPAAAPASAASAGGFWDDLGDLAQLMDGAAGQAGGGAAGVAGSAPGSGQSLMSAAPGPAANTFSPWAAGPGTASGSAGVAFATPAAAHAAKPAESPGSFWDRTDSADFSLGL